jgi:hypothetical protein
MRHGEAAAHCIGLADGETRWRGMTAELAATYFFFGLAFGSGESACGSKPT